MGDAWAVIVTVVTAPLLWFTGTGGDRGDLGRPEVVEPVLGVVTVGLLVLVAGALAHRGRRSRRAGAALAVVGALLLGGGGVALWRAAPFTPPGYLPVVPPGSAVSRGHFGDPREPGTVSLQGARDAVAAAMPGAAVGFLGDLRVVQVARNRVADVYFPAPGCSPAETMRGSTTPRACARPAYETDDGNDHTGGLTVTDSGTAARILGVGASGRAALDAGHIVVRRPLPGNPARLTSQRITARSAGGALRPVQVAPPVEVPVTVDTGLDSGLPPTTYDDGLGDVRERFLPDAVVTPETAARLGGTVSWDELVVTSPTGRIGFDDTARLREALPGIGSAELEVENGPRRPRILGALLAAGSACVLLGIGVAAGGTWRRTRAGRRPGPGRRGQGDASPAGSDA